ncbi:MAG: hypothetical protein U0264_01050 [Candidatus Kapaibacterium sp.]
MNHNLLISKYLDGDLSVEEDNELRRLLSENSDIKEEFDAATMLHFMFKEDAESIQIPFELLAETEQVILNKYSELPTAQTLTPRHGAAGYARTVSSFLAVLILFSVLPFGDGVFPVSSIGLGITGAMEPQTSESGAQERRIGYSGHGIHHDKSMGNKLVVSSIRTTTSAGVQQDVSVSSGEPYGPSNETTNGALFADNKQGSMENSQRDIQFPTLPQSTMAAVYQNPTITSASPSGLKTFLPTLISDQYKQSDIQVNTFVSTMISLPGNYSNATANISQSIAYSLGSENRVGIEVGYFGYSYQDGGTVLVPKSSSLRSTGTILGMDDPSPGANDFSAERTSSSLSNGFEEKKVAYSIDKNMYWGAAFYEHTLLNSDKLSLNGRIGVGGSNDGPMAFTRAYAKYNVFSDIAVTLGAEGSTFIVHAPLMTRKSVEATSGISLVYGMQIKF